MTEASGRIRVLVVDDSAFARKVLRQSLQSHPAIEVVGAAHDGLEALEKIAELAPDVVTLDLMMPHLDGVGVLRELAALRSPARVLVVSIADEDSEAAVEALSLGAVDLVRKPTALATDRLFDLSAELVSKVLGLGRARPPTVKPPPMPRAVVPSGALLRTSLVVVGTSTGGPQALTRLLADLPADFPVPIAIALHIPSEYTEALAKRLDTLCPLDVVEARAGLAMRPGLVVLAKGGSHLRVERERDVLVSRTGGRDASLHSPSVDHLFESAAVAGGSGAFGVVLTGMGNDGLVGSAAIVKGGGRVVTESEASCVVYGMPRSVREAGLSCGEATLEEMADAIVRRL